MKAIILAGGKGKRLAPFTTTIPKPLFPVGEKTILEIIIKQLRHAKINKVKLAVGYLAELIEAYFGNGKKFGISITYQREQKPLGTAGPIYAMKNEKNSFLVMNGDVLAEINFKKLFEFHKRSKAIATICCYEKTVNSSLGVIEADAHDLLKNYKEKPSSKHLVSTGIYCFKPSVLKYIKKGEHIDLPQFIMRLVENKQDVKIYRMKGKWFDIGTPEDYTKAVEYWGNKKR